MIFQKIKRKHDKNNVIPSNSEWYISFDVGHLMIPDSMQFLSHGLNKLVEQMSSDQKKHLVATYPEHWKLLSRKGIYYYDYMKSMVWFDETTLPSKDRFCSKLYDKHVSEEQYKYAGDVWEKLKCNTMKDYHNHCLITNILLLADVFENFRLGSHSLL